MRMRSDQRNLHEQALCLAAEADSVEMEGDSARAVRLRARALTIESREARQAEEHLMPDEVTSRLDAWLDYLRDCSERLQAVLDAVDDAGRVTLQTDEATLQVLLQTVEFRTRWLPVLVAARLSVSWSLHLSFSIAAAPFAAWADSVLTQMEATSDGPVPDRCILVRHNDVTITAGDTRALLAALRKEPNP